MKLKNSKCTKIVLILVGLYYISATPVLHAGWFDWTSIKSSIMQKTASITKLYHVAVGYFSSFWHKPLFKKGETSAPATTIDKNAYKGGCKRIQDLLEKKRS